MAPPGDVEGQSVQWHASGPNSFSALPRDILVGKKVINKQVNKRNKTQSLVILSLHLTKLEFLITSEYKQIEPLISKTSGAEFSRMKE